MQKYRALKSTLGTAQAYVQTVNVFVMKVRIEIPAADFAMLRLADLHQ